MGNSQIPKENTLKITHIGNNDEMQYICMQMKGWRQSMQDTALHILDLNPKQTNGNSLYAVFDGHGTSYISKYVKDNFAKVLINLSSYKLQNYTDALQETFKKLDEMMLSQQGQQELAKIKKQQDSQQDSSKYQKVGPKIGYYCGCTANVILITKDSYYVANCGDSRSVLCRSGYKMDLSKDHKPQNPSQTERIKKAGGQVFDGRINDIISVSRAFGDFEFKKNKQLPYDQQMVICKPDIEVFGRSDRDQFLLIACDGIWENFSKSTPIVEFICKDKNYKKGDYTLILESLMNKLIAQNQEHVFGKDNMTALLVKLNMNQTNKKGEQGK